MKKNSIKVKDVTPELKKEWSAKYGEGKCAIVTATDEDGSVKKCFLRPPTRSEMGAYSVAYRTNPVKANESLAKSIWLAGDEEMLTSDYLFYAVAEKLPDMIKSAEAELDMF